MENYSINEIWKPVNGFEGLYEVSNKGRVRSLDHYVTQKGNFGVEYERLYKGREIVPVPCSVGYETITLSNGKTKKTVLVHRIVAEAFIPNPIGLPQVNHRNELKDDNRVENLEWCTEKYNVNYGTGMARASRKRGSPVLQITRGGDIVGRFSNANVASQETGIPYRNIYAVLNKTQDKYGFTRKSAGGFVWVYEGDCTPE